MDEPAPPVAEDIPLPPGLPEPAVPRLRLRWWQGMLAMLVAVVMLVIANVAVLVVIMLAEHGPSGVMAAVGNPQALISFPMLAAGQIANLLVFLVVAALFPFVASVPHRSALGLSGAPAGTFLWGALGILGLGPLADRIVTTLKPYFPEQSSLEMIEAAIAGQPLWVLVPFLAVMPALGEELLCRGVLQRSIPWPAVALPVSAVFFAALHMDPLHMAGVLPLGFYLAWLGHRTGSVWVPVFAHFTNNLAATLAMHFSESTELASTDELPLWAVPVGVLFTLVAATLLHARMRAAEAPAALPDNPAPEANDPSESPA